MRVGQNPQVGTLASGMQEGGRGADPPAAINRALHIGHAFLDRTVVVGIARNAERDGALDEGLAQGVAPIHVGDGEIAGPSAEAVVAAAEPALEPLKVG